jgi:hypothetical protein
MGAASDVTVMAIVTAVGTFLTAFQLFQPKFSISVSMKRETGRVEPAFFAFYTLSQYISGAVVLLVWATLVAAVLHQIAPGFVVAKSWVQEALPFLALENLIPILLIGAVMAGAIQMNILSWGFILLGRALSMLPFPGVSGAFGPEGRSAGWLQAWCICRTWDKGQPLLISQEESQRVGDELLRKLSVSTYTGRNFAPKPAKASTAAAANIALFGCIIEEAHGANRWTAPASWEDFYSALADINDVNKMFEPSELVKFKSGQLFSQTLRDELAARMQAKGHPVPDGNYYGAASYVAIAYRTLKAYKGSMLKMVPFFAGVIGSKLYWINRCLAKFPLLHGEGMRQQTIKLMTRWNITPWAKKENFLQPFSKSQAWLLLQEGVLTTLPEQKDVTFRSYGDVGISKIACRRVFEHVRQGAEEGLSAEAISVSRRFPETWDLFAAADYTLWNWAHEQSEKGKAADWKGWRWKLDAGRASRVS